MLRDTLVSCSAMPGWTELNSAGNIALRLVPDIRRTMQKPTLFPQKSKIYTQPTFEDCDGAKLNAEMFYEIHPQLWGNGLMSEAFTEVLRFAMEEVGCCKLIVSVLSMLSRKEFCLRCQCDPTVGNEASIKLCLRNGLTYTHTTSKFDQAKPQMFHEISRKDWWAKNRPGKEIIAPWGGKEICRW